MIGIADPKLRKPKAKGLHHISDSGFLFRKTLALDLARNPVNAHSSQLTLHSGEADVLPDAYWVARFRFTVATQRS